MIVAFFPITRRAAPQRNTNDMFVPVVPRAEPIASIVGRGDTLRNWSSPHCALAHIQPSQMQGNVSISGLLPLTIPIHVQKCFDRPAANLAATPKCCFIFLATGDGGGYSHCLCPLFTQGFLLCASKFCPQDVFLCRIVPLGLDMECQARGCDVRLK